jgi:hypothetical protein
MRFTRPSHQPLPAVPAKSDGEVVELSLLDGMEHGTLRDLFVGLWLKDQFRVTLDCSHVDHLTLPEVLMLVRFSNEFSCRGGFVRLNKANARVRSTLRGLSCTHLLARTRATMLGGARLGKERSYAQ